jgi:hypothetical protein
LANGRFAPIVLQKSFCGRGLKFSDPWTRTCRLFRPLAENQPQGFLGLLQHYRHLSDVSNLPNVRFPPPIPVAHELISVFVNPEKRAENLFDYSENPFRMSN